MNIFLHTRSAISIFSLLFAAASFADKKPSHGAEPYEATSFADAIMIGLSAEVHTAIELAKISAADINTLVSKGPEIAAEIANCNVSKDSMGNGVCSLPTKSANLKWIELLEKIRDSYNIAAKHYKSEDFETGLLDESANGILQVIGLLDFHETTQREVAYFEIRKKIKGKMKAIGANPEEIDVNKEKRIAAIKEIFEKASAQAEVIRSKP